MKFNTSVSLLLRVVAAILLIVPYTAFVGALSGVALMLGAIFSHLMVVGIQSNGDGGELFMLALVVLLCCLVTLWLQKEEGRRDSEKIST